MKRHEANETRAERLEHSKCLINASWLVQEKRETFNHKHLLELSSMACRIRGIALGLMASTTMRQEIPVALSPWSVVVCCGSPGKAAQA